MKIYRSVLTLILLIGGLPVFSQIPYTTWKGGSQLANQEAAYPLPQPGARIFPSMWNTNTGKLWLFGGVGRDKNGAEGRLNDFWEFDISTSEWTFIGGSDLINRQGDYGTKGVSAPTNFPGSRYGAAEAVDGTGNLWMFGGGDGNPTLNDLWKYDPLTEEWTWVSGTNQLCCQSGVYGTKGTPSTSNYPGSRFSTMVADDSGNLWVFGGSGIGSGPQADFLNDLWKFNIATGEWTWVAGSDTVNPIGQYGTVEQSSSTNDPGGRTNTEIWYDENDNIWVFGGIGLDENGDTGQLNDLWKFDTNTSQWTWMGGTKIINQPGAFGTKGIGSTSNIPPSKQGHGVWYETGGVLWMVHGAGGEEIWKYEIATKEWTWVSGRMFGDTPLYGTQGVEDPANLVGRRTYASYQMDNTGNLWIFGGDGLDKFGIPGSMNDLWKWNSITDLYTWVRGTDLVAQPGIFTGQGIEEPTNHPGQRLYPADWKDADGNLWMFGGGYNDQGNSEQTNDLWKYNASTGNWAWIKGSLEINQPSVVGTQGIADELNTPGARQEAAHWTDNDGVFWLFGGWGWDVNGNRWWNNDLWKFDPRPTSPDFGMWTFISGTQTSGNQGNYGIKGVADQMNLPPCRTSKALFDPVNNVAWLFGGVNFDPLNDLWKFDMSNGLWTWVSGSNTPNQPGIYTGGSQVPGARNNSYYWRDNSGDLWVFGGFGVDKNSTFGALSDVWKYSTGSDSWSFISGSQVIGAPAVYGTQYVSSPSNTPGQRQGGSSWADDLGNLWLFGGAPQQIDLWKYNIQSGEWTWMVGGQDLPPNYGELNVASIDNNPGFHFGAATWLESNGNVKLFGGAGNADSGPGGFLNDFWEIGLSPTPTSITGFTLINQTGFTVNWETVGAPYPATGYELDVASDAAFTSIIPGYENLATTATSLEITGLSSGTTYYVRVRATNTTGASLNSMEMSVLTTPANPVAQPAESVEQTSFAVVWDPVPSATVYRFGISLNANMANPLPEYDFSSGFTSTSIGVSGFDPGTIYFYSVIAENASGQSNRSNIISLLTKPANPVAAEPVADDISPTTFKAEWGFVTGADDYLVEVSDDDFVTLLSGYDPLVVDGSTNNTIVTDLIPTTIYKFRVRSRNATGESGNSNVVSVQTDAPDIPLEIGIDTYVNTNSNQTLNITALGGVPPYTVTLRYKGLTEENFTEITLTETSPRDFPFEVNSSLLDELGLEFEATLTDFVGETDELTGINRIYRSITDSNSPEIPFTRFGGKSDTWNLFSIPYQLDQRSVGSIFSDLDPQRHEFDWRIVRYRNSTNEYSNFNTGSVQLGEAYWFNSKNTIVVTTGAGSVTTSIPFDLSLSGGWNLVGNPYPIPISWNAVLAENSGITGINTILMYNGSGYVEGDVIEPFSGGFVFADANPAGQFLIDPVRTKSGGRTEDIPGIIESRDIDDEKWLLQITHFYNGNSELLGGVGMHPEAADLKDPFDKMTVPRFFEYSEMHTERNEYFYPWFSTDIVPTRSSQVWDFTLSSNKSRGISEISWDHIVLQNKNAKLHLLDKVSGRLINMSEQSSIAVDLTKGDYSFEIHYTGNNEIITLNSMLGIAFPNPVDDLTTIPVSLPGSNDHDIQLSVYDINGKMVKVLAEGIYSPGYHEFTWNIENKELKGLYLYELRFRDNHFPPVLKKIVLK